MSEPITFKINGRSSSVEKPTTIIEAADRLGIYIPRFCYHKKLSVVANCRMCLVEVEGFPKPVPACATAIMKDMQVLTRSQKAKEAQRAVMEFLLINHPLDCPVCDQGGQCELQDLAMRYGRDNSEFEEDKRAVANEDLGSLVATEMTRCIQCTRCLRFEEEVAGKRELGAIGRGEHTQITTHVNKPLTSELSGNIIDVCPVGALTSKPFRFQARAWEMRSSPSISPHDCLGSHLALHTFEEQVMRVTPREEESINEVWLSDRDRYSYVGLVSDNRLTHPMIKQDGEWQTVSWEEALQHSAALLRQTLTDPTKLGGLISPSATLEEMYLFQKLCRGLGSSNIDHRLHETDISDQCNLPAYPVSSVSIQDLVNCELIILIGSNIQREQPLLVTRLRQAVAKGASVISINCLDYDFNFPVAHRLIVPPNQLPRSIQDLVEHVKGALSDNTVLKDVAKLIGSADRTAILTGALAHNHPEAGAIRSAVYQLRQETQALWMPLTEGANGAGGWIGGAVPHRLPGGKALAPSAVGLSCQEMLSQPLAAYLLFNVEPALDCANPHQAQQAMLAAECVIACSSFTSETLRQQANVMLPIASLGENSGTFVNVEGKHQVVNRIIPGPDETREGWVVLDSLLHQLNIQQESQNITSIRQMLAKADITQITVDNPVSVEINPPVSVPGWQRITEWPMHSIDSLTRASEALQRSGSSELTGAYLNPVSAIASNLEGGQWVQLRQGNALSQRMKIILDNKVPEGCIWTPAGRSETASLGESFGSIEVVV